MDKEYRQKVRSLSYNLSDASNPELRARVLQGEVTPDRLVQMTPNELASKVTMGVNLYFHHIGVIHLEVALSLPEVLICVKSLCYFNIHDMNCE